MKIVNERQAEEFLPSLNAYLFSGLSEECDIRFETSAIVLGDVIGQQDIIANHDLVVLGSLSAPWITVHGSLKCFSSIEAEVLDINQDLLCLGRVAGIFGSVGGMAILHSVEIRDDLEVGRQLYCLRDCVTNGKTIIGDIGLFGEGLTALGGFEASQIISMRYCDGEVLGNTRVSVLDRVWHTEAAAPRLSVHDLQERTEDFARLAALHKESQTILNDVLDGYLDTIDDLVAWDETEEHFRELADSIPQAELYASLFASALRLSEKSQMGTVGDFLALAWLKWSCPDGLLRHPLVKSVIEESYDKELRRISSLYAKISAPTDLAEQLMQLEAVRRHLSRRQYEILLRKILDAVGIPKSVFAQFFSK